MKHMKSYRNGCLICLNALFVGREDCVSPLSRQRGVNPQLLGIVTELLQIQMHGSGVQILDGFYLN